MKSHYAHAVLQVLQAGTPIEAALNGLSQTLAKRNHSKLHAAVLLEVLRVLEAKKGIAGATVYVASTTETPVLESSIRTALASLGVQENTPVRTIVDESLIGGFVVTHDYKEHDQSYKKVLTSLYESITR